jgi:hypothetical protein
MSTRRPVWSSTTARSCLRTKSKLLEAYEANVWPLGADFEPHWCLVLSLDTKLADIT